MLQSFKGPQIPKILCRNWLEQISLAGEGGEISCNPGRSAAILANQPICFAYPFGKSGKV